MKSFVPENINWGDVLPMNVLMRMRIETNIKLQLIDTSGNPLISKDDEYKPEVHFLQLEAITHEYPISSKAFGAIWRAWRNRHKQEYKNWTVTDFDHCLNGNPILWFLISCFLQKRIT